MNCKILMTEKWTYTNRVVVHGISKRQQTGRGSARWRAGGTPLSRCHLLEHKFLRWGPVGNNCLFVCGLWLETKYHHKSKILKLRERRFLRSIYKDKQQKKNIDNDFENDSDIHASAHRATSVLIIINNNHSRFFHIDFYCSYST